MKTLYMIGGTMGVGKTSVCQKLNDKLGNSVFLDGDWCWSTNLKMINIETKEMVIENICYLLNQYIKCNSYEFIVFCWVLHKQSIINKILSKINIENCVVKNISLLCNENILVERLNKDITAGIRTTDVIERSLERLKEYEKLDTYKIDTSDKNIDKLCDEILNIK